MHINCFRASRGNSLEFDDDRPRPVNIAKKSHRVRRQGSGDSAISKTSTLSNESTSKLPPCSRSSDPKIEAMMMPIPHDARPSRCLRLSHPRIYSNLVYDMKTCKGCRDWRSFDVFYDDDVDMSITADEAARKKALEYQLQLRMLNSSFESGPSTQRSTSVDAVDMIC